MDISQFTSIVLEKIKKFEPEHASKIIGYLLMQDRCEEEMVKLASYPDQLIREVAFKARTELQMLAANSAIHPISIPISSQQDLRHMSLMSPGTPTSPASFQVPSPYWDPQSVGNANSEFLSMGYLESVSELEKQAQLLSLESYMDAINSGTAGIANDYYGLDASPGNLGRKNGRRYSSLSLKACHYFHRGFCKHNYSCRCFHRQVVPEMFSQIYGNDAPNEDQEISPRSLAQLESEIIELLKSRRGNPISIASLPSAYFEKYKKVLQADGYLTESQRHGRPGYNLSKLLERLGNSIRLIGRPHGQHSVVLAENNPRFMGKGEFGKNISASRQLYLTFPADSTFTEEDVSNYFNTFGSVEDVRIPCQQRRMFGFVTFVDPETVKMILDEGNAHYVGESRVLVKPYKEKPKLTGRKHPDRIEHSICYSQHYVDVDTELTIPRGCRNPRFLRRLMIEEQEHALEFQRRRIAEMQLAQKFFTSSPHSGFNMEEFKASDDHFNSQPVESFNYTPNNQAVFTVKDTDYTNEDINQGLNLPESPFAFPVDSGISAVM